MHDAGEDDVDVGVFGADPVLDAGGENAVVFCSLLPSDRTVSFGEAGDGVLGGLTNVVIIETLDWCLYYFNKGSQTHM